MTKTSVKKLTVVLTAVAILWPVFSHAHNSGFDQGVIYYNEACGMCATYVASELPDMLKKHGVKEFIKKDYVSDRQNRVEMNEKMSQSGVPLDLQSHIMTFVGDKYIIAGHVPKSIIDDIFDEKYSHDFKKIIVYQDEMHGDVKDYRVWAAPEYADDFAGEIKTYPVNTAITEYFDYLKNNKNELKFSGKPGDRFDKYKSLLPVILISGFLDGINPCAFAVLLFFIAFLYTLQRTRKTIWKMSLVYIAAIYLAYLLIGFGIMKAILFSNSPHFMAKLGSWLVIVLGLINLIGYYFPEFPVKLQIPAASKETLQTWIYKATLPAAFVLGFLVGLCTFPCSGGIYVAIIGLLAAKTTYWSGVIYLLFYNLMFVLPLIIILIFASNKFALEKITQWEQSKSKSMRLLSALTMIALGAVIIIFFT
ncbi:hypothetical protein C4569_02080 [Candidatus Parcubacteria bacterium]|nr:MAG: hypothetical protein C4569_02080 [Candidatus Parcubacteria bacterium]